MRGRVIALLVGVAIAIGGAALAGAPGGFPSRPTVDRLNVRDPAAPVGEKLFQLDNVAGDLTGRTLTDAGADNWKWLTVESLGGAVQSVEYRIDDAGFPATFKFQPGGTTVTTDSSGGDYFTIVNLNSLLSTAATSNISLITRDGAMTLSQTDTTYVASGTLGGATETILSGSASYWGNTGALGLAPNFSEVAAFHDTGTTINLHGGAGTTIAIGNTTINPAVNINGQHAARSYACTTACNVTGLKVGDFATISKGTATNRASTTATAADADLQFTNLPIGSYSVEAHYSFTTGAGGYRITDLHSSALSETTGIDACNGVGVTAKQFGTGLVVQCATTSFGNGTMTGQLVTTAVGTYSISWAQNSSSVANSTLTTGSYVKLQRLN